MLDTKNIQIDAQLEYRFWRLVNKKGEDECWRWIGCGKETYYGWMGHKGRTLYAHRISYEIHKGHIEKGVLILHKCNNPSCVNPKHLYEGTHKDNSRDKELTENHNRGSNNPGSKLTEKDVIEIKRLIQVEFWRTRKDIGEQFGVSGPAIGLIAMGKRWGHLK